MKNEVFRSPLFYVGDKYKLIKEIHGYFPAKINKFIEPFAGGGSVFMNVRAEEYYLNDIDKNVYQLHIFLQEQAKTPALFYEKIEAEIEKYGLSRSYKTDIIPSKLKEEWKKTFYAKFNQEGFERLRNDFNLSDKQNILHLYLLLIYGFNRMIRFNSAGNYNLPTGNVDFNGNVVSALNNYFKINLKRKINWFNRDYIDFVESIEINSNDFVYFDPPYLITFSEYNKLWNIEKEKEMIEKLDSLNEKNIKFAVSNVTHYKGNENTLFSEWAKKYQAFPIKSNYISYHDNSVKSFKEVLVTNYEQTKIQL